MSRPEADPPRSTNDYAASLRERLGMRGERPRAAETTAAADLAWASSGAMWLTGEPAGPPVVAPGPFALAAAEAVSALADLSGAAALSRLDGAALLGERAAAWGAERRGRISPGGTCRLLRSADGWLALNLARPEDEALVPALLEGESMDASVWSALERALPGQSTAAWVSRGRLMGLPIAPCDPPRTTPPPWLESSRFAPADQRTLARRPLVLDLSALWAGPLCTHLLGLAGARVVKIESTRRVDGARGGPAELFDLLNAGKEMVALDFGDPGDRRRLRALIARADIVVESARPRALRQLGVDAEEILRSTPGLTWLGITGYGRAEPEADWVAFGDDAAVAAGAAGLTGEPGARPLFCGDALADPLAGTHAALAAWAAYRAGGGELLDVSLRDVTEHVLGWREDETARHDAMRLLPDPTPGSTGWRLRIGDIEQPVLAPRVRPAREAARPSGADTTAVLTELIGDRA